MIEPHLASFLEEGLSIHIGTRDEALRPEGGRAAAVTVSQGGRQLVVYVPDPAFSRIRSNIEANAFAAIGFGRPVDDRACQVKGNVVTVRPATDDEKPIVAAQWDGFMRQLEMIGIPRGLAANWSMWPAVAVTIRVTAVFEQTPGPQAGHPMDFGAQSRDA